MVQKKRAQSIKKNTGAPKRPQNAPASEKPSMAINREKAGFPIVGIGASAGGLESLEKFFTNMPSDSGMAFVLVQHLDPTHKSILVDLVKRYTRMEVFEVADGMKIEPNCAYVIPPNRDMAMFHGILQLIEPTARRGLRLPIDFFFRSFAQDQQERAICIVLSGTGTDGTLGLKAIKGEGGMAIVEDPESAKYDGMPRSAIATGLVDFILPPDNMMGQLVAYVQHAFGPESKRAAAPIPETSDYLQKIFILVRAQTGHDFSFYKKNAVIRRIERRMTVNQINNPTAYVRYLQQNPMEVETLFKELLIRVSNFFRDPEAFELLREKVIPGILENKGQDQPVRIWVPGCSTGEEAYTIAMLVREWMDELKQEFKVQIFATDIDRDAIDTARMGIYPQGIAVDVAPQRLKRFFSKDDSTYQVKKPIRDMLVFAVQNLVKDPHFSKLDLISCRNLMIYLEPELQRKVLSLFHYSLNPDGYLLLGNSESLGDFTDYFAVLEKKWKLFRRKPDTSLARPVVNFAIPGMLVGPEKTMEQEGKKERKISFRELAEKTLLESYSPPCVIINEKADILYIHGRTGKYLEPAPGEANLNILGMARKGLRLELSTAIRKAVMEKKEIHSERLQINTNGGIDTINLTVRPFLEPPSRRGTLMVTFEDMPARKHVESVGLPGWPGGVDRRVAELEQELSSTKEYLQTTIEELQASNEELQSANEELQSANEELQSTNEELQTSKEELQSINEELMTVNSEHEINLGELSKVNNDMINLLSSTDVGIIFLDMNLRIKRFTPEATTVFNLIQTDVGRPLSDIASNLGYDSLIPDAKGVLDTLVPKESQVHTTRGIWYLIRVKPYRTTDNVIAGVVIISVDITVQKRSEEYRLLATVVRDSNDAITVQDFEGKLLAWNRGAEKMYGWSEPEALAMNIIEIIPQGKREEALAFGSKLKKGETVSSFETKRLTKDGRELTVWLTATTLVDVTGNPIGVATTERDIAGVTAGRMT